MSNNDTIRSDLPLPTESAFLNRPQKVHQLTKKLEEQPNFSTITLVGITGIGGAGKTTLARYYAHSHSFPLVWEINAETKESLINSFKDLAYAFAKSKAQKEELAFILQIKTPEEQEKQLLLFVKNQLRHHKNWFLIFDNVESFSNIKTFLPRDSETWGKGKVIVTTQDSNIQNANFIKFDSTIQIDKLSPDEALTFFCKILYGLDSSQLTHEQRKEAKEFLSCIPLFPLDVSLAAYYIKNSQITYKQYLDRLNLSGRNFEKTQENLIKEVSDYNKTRNRIMVPENWTEK